MQNCIGTTTRAKAPPIPALPQAVHIDPPEQWLKRIEEENRPQGNDAPSAAGKSTLSDSDNTTTVSRISFAPDGGRQPGNGTATATTGGSAARDPKIQRLISAAERAGVVPEVLAVALEHDIDPLLVHAIIHVESRHNPKAVSPAGAVGLMQVMPATAATLGLQERSKLSDPATNIRLGVQYLKRLGKMFDHNLELVLAAYNAGEGAVIKSGYRVPNYEETRNYVREVTGTYLRLRSPVETGVDRGVL